MTALSALALAATLRLCYPVSVHDGDTIRCGTERVRIANIDAPELPDSPKCRDRRRHGWCDYKLALASRDALKAFLARGPVLLRRQGVDRYGRTLALVTAKGQDVGDYLIGRALARQWR